MENFITISYDFEKHSSSVDFRGRPAIVTTTKVYLFNGEG